MKNEPQMIPISSRVVEEDGKVFQEMVYRMPLDIGQLKQEREKKIKEADMIVDVFDTIEKDTSVKIKDKPKKLNQ
jgi:hypothetical protein